MNARERADIIINQYRDSIISGRKENLAALIEFHIAAAEQKAVEHYKDVYEKKCIALTKARKARTYGRTT